MPGGAGDAAVLGDGDFLKRPVTDLGASVRDRLKALARAGTNEFTAVLGRYGLERLLYRLSKSEWHDRFVLKGAMLFAVWSRKPHRSTRDMDLLGLMPPDTRQLRAIFRKLCAIPVEPDGLVFHADSVRARQIQEQHPYHGIRVTLTATLKRTRIALQVDVGTGDAVVPPAEEIDYRAMQLTQVAAFCGLWAWTNGPGRHPTLNAGSEPVQSSNVAVARQALLPTVGAARGNRADQRDNPEGPCLSTPMTGPKDANLSQLHSPDRLSDAA